MRLLSKLWVSAFLRRVNGAGAQAVLTRRGEESAGAIYIKVTRLDGTAELFSPALSMDMSGSYDRCWQSEFGEVRPEAEIDGFLSSQSQFDSDIWIIEIEDVEGRHFLADQLISL